MESPPPFSRAFLAKKRYNTTNFPATPLLPAMSVRLTFPDLLRTSVLRFSDFSRETGGILLLLGSAVFIILAFGSLMSPVFLPFAFAALMLAAVLAVSLLPSTRRLALRRKIHETRAELLEKNSRVLESLRQPGRLRYNRLHTSVIRLSDLVGEDKHTVVRPGEYLLWLYLKLLIARDHLEENAEGSRHEALLAERARLEVELRREDLSLASRQSKGETLDLLEQRISAARTRAVKIEEVESDLLRIEHQLALLCDRAAQRSPLGDSGFRIELAAETFATATSGDLAGNMTVQQVEQLFVSNFAD